MVAPTATAAIAMPSIRRNGSPSISMRSAKVPLSPSSALQTMYLRSALAAAAVRHLIPVGKPAPPRPRITKQSVDLESLARQSAEDEIRKAAMDDGILDQAQKNAEAYLLRFFNALGYQNVTFV